MMGHLRHVSPPDFHLYVEQAAVLCAAQGCNHHGCQGGPFRVALLNAMVGTISGWLYSSETNNWSELAPNVKCRSGTGERSILVRDAVYFNCDAIIKCQLGTLSLSMFEKPIRRNGHLMTAEDGGLGFAAVVDFTNLTIWSMETGSMETIGWAKLRVIHLKTLLHDGGLIPQYNITRPHDLDASVSAVAEGTQVIFVCTYVGHYMVDLKSGQVRNMPHHHRRSFPYTSFYIPGITYVHIYNSVHNPFLQFFGGT
jgi:hypothetical protein